MRPLKNLLSRIDLKQALFILYPLVVGALVGVLSARCHWAIRFSLLLLFHLINCAQRFMITGVLFKPRIDYSDLEAELAALDRECRRMPS